MGSTSNSAQRQAEAAERERERQINATTSRINAMFDSPGRAQQRTDYGTALREFYVADANRQKEMADRNLKFAMARSGLTGGSASTDANKTLGEEYQRGILEADRRVQAGVADLMGRDEQTRLSLIGQAQAGLNATAANQQAAAAMRANLEGANAAARVEGLGDIFGSIADAKTYSEEQAERRRSDRDYLQRQGMYQSAFSGWGG